MIQLVKDIPDYSGDKSIYPDYCWIAKCGPLDANRLLYAHTKLLEAKIDVSGDIWRVRGIEHWGLYVPVSEYNDAVIVLMTEGFIDV